MADFQSQDQLRPLYNDILIRSEEDDLINFNETPKKRTLISLFEQKEETKIQMHSLTLDNEQTKKRRKITPILIEEANNLENLLNKEEEDDDEIVTPDLQMNDELEKTYPIKKEEEEIVTPDLQMNDELNRMNILLSNIPYISSTTSRKRNKMNPKELVYRNWFCQKELIDLDVKLANVLEQNEQFNHKEISKLDNQIDKLLKEQDEIEDILSKKYNLLGGARFLVNNYGKCYFYCI